MAEIIFRLPSKATQYGYVEVRDTVDTEVTPEELAEKYAAWVIRFQATEMAAKPKKPDSRLVGNIMDRESAIDEIAGVYANGGVDPVATASVEAFDVNMAAVLAEDADDGNGHWLSSEEVAGIVRSELGGSVVEEIKSNPTAAPWDGKGKVPDNLQPKPWQKGARKAPVADLFS